MNKRLGTSFGLLMFMGVVSLASVTAYADSHRGRGHSSGNENHYGYSRGHNDYDRYNDRTYNAYRERVVYYTPGYRPSYQVVYYQPWRPQPVMTSYHVGEFLPRHVRCYEPPREVVAVLPPVHRGTRYVQVDRNVYLVSEATKQILDAVVLMSGVR